MPSIKLQPEPGIHALNPQAFGLEFLIPSPAGNAGIPGATVVEVCGPLAYASGLLDTYACLRERFALALAESTPCVIVKFNSPGGEVSGAFDTARWMRQAARTAGKHYIAFTEAQCCSAAYVLASGADEIVISDSATIGSVGVIQCLEIVAAADAMQGKSYELVTSGARKADGNPHAPVSDAARVSIQRGVDQMAGIFYSVVSDHRGVDAQPLEGVALIGAAAVAAGLADRVASWDALCLSAADGSLGTTLGQTSQVTASEEPNRMADKQDPPPKEDSVRDALKLAALSEDKDKAAKALKALAAYDGPADDGDKDKDKDKDAKAEDEKPKPDASASGGDATSAVAALAAQVAAQGAVIAQFQANAAATERAALMATRPDLAASAAALATLTLDQLKAVLGSVPKAFASQAPQLGSTPLHGSPDMTAGDPALAARMGLTPMTKGSSFDGVTLKLGIDVPATAKA